ncbi:paar repeat-containing protein [Massilia pseudoviolaceinigra]|uniref:paar repeat-containing protein n=1 Tax=Massilia pseudoviolaceinigra TaxID=3057165 RepID=UPI002796C3F2|nr:paar repeat-containing protein [Massilia sp. CCM 9206]MDQ1923888.1 paar repeat-containing protein [Massilia sp. CCM 9206]
MSATLISPSGAVLHHRARVSTTPADEAEAKAVRIRLEKACRLEENRVYLKQPNIRAFLRAMCHSLGGGVDFLDGAIRGRRSDPWRFTDFSTHPGPGHDGKSTAAGLYRITREIWEEYGARMDLTDFCAETQELIAVEVLRGLGVLGKIQAGDIDATLVMASACWPGLPKTPASQARFAAPDAAYESFLHKYGECGGTINPQAGGGARGQGGPLRPDLPPARP